MKQSLLLVFGIALVGLISCKDEEPKIDPIVGEWELDGVEIVAPTNFSGYGGTGSSLYGEDSYIFEFLSDLTFTRELDNIPGSTGSFDIDQEGEYEKTTDELELDPDESVGGLPDDFEIVELTADKMFLSYQEENVEAFPDEIWEIWDETNANDTIDTEEEYNAVFAEYGSYIELEVILEFDKQ